MKTGTLSVCLIVVCIITGCKRIENQSCSANKELKPLCILPATFDRLSDVSGARKVVEVPVVADAGVMAGNRKDQNLGKRQIIEVKNFDDTPKWGWVLQRVFLKFDLQVFDSAKIKSANLCVYGNLGDGCKPVSVDVFPIDDQNDNWQENSITWNNQPPTKPDRIGQLNFTFGNTSTRKTEGRWYVSSDITKYIINEVENGNKIVSLSLKTEIREEACLFTKEHSEGANFCSKLIIGLAD